MSWRLRRGRQGAAGEITGQKAVQPDPLFEAEWRILWNSRKFNHAEGKSCSEIHRGLDIDPIRVSGTVSWSRKTALDVIADKEMAVANFELSEACDGVTGDDIQFVPDEIVVARD